MMNKTKLRIMLRAISIRLSKGEKFNDILASYPKLTDEDKEKIKAKLGMENS